MYLQIIPLLSKIKLLLEGYGSLFMAEHTLNIYLPQTLSCAPHFKAFKIHIDQ